MGAPEVDAATTDREAHGPPTIETVLVPIDGSDETERAVDHAVGIAERYDAGLHALVVLGEDVAAALDEGRLSEDDVAERGTALARVAREAAPPSVPVTDSTALGFSAQRKLTHPGSVVLDCAAEARADFLVVPREPVAGDAEDTLEKVAEYVVSYASQPVLSV